MMTLQIKVHCTQKMLVMVVFVRTLMYFSGESTQCQCIFHVFATLYLHSCSLVNYLILFCSTFTLQDMDTLANTTTIHNNPNRNYHHITVNSISESCHNYIVKQKCHICSNMTNKAFIFNLKIGLHNARIVRALNDPPQRWRQAHIPKSKALKLAFLFHLEST